ncbi:MAG: S9 family peptidase [Planctomycetales bacterium]|nr:S9 family peptidase [Planctomycetales bacterium]
MISAPLFLMGLIVANSAVLAEDDVSPAGDDPRRPPAIRTVDVPVVPDELAEQLLRYQNVRAAAFRGWAPDGEGILIETRFGNSAQLHRVFEPGGRREQVTFFDEPAGGRFVPESADDALLVSLSRGGSENDQIYLLEPGGSLPKLLTDGVSRNSLGPVRDDGSQMIVRSNKRNGRDTDIYVLDMGNPASERLVYETDGDYWVATDWSPDGKTLAMIRYVSINESYLGLLDVATGELTPLDGPTDQVASFGNAAFSADGKSLFVSTDARGEFQQLAQLDLANGTYEWLSDDIDWDVDEVAVDRRSGLVAFTVNEDGGSTLYLLDGAEHTRVQTPVGIIGSLDFSPDSKRLGLSLARADAPTDAYSLDLGTLELTRWTFSEVGGLDPDTFVVPERIRFPSFDGREIPAWFFRPPTASADRPAPVLIQIHGGPESQYRPFFSGLVQYYVNELGLAVIAPNVRGSAGYGKSYLKLDNGPLREDSVQDIGALLDWIAEQPELDASRVVVTGGSYGGYMVLASLVKYGERLRAGVDVVGIASFISFLERTSPYRQDLRRAEYGDERDPEMRAIFQRIDPIANADKIASALLVAHGVNDPRVPFFEAEQIADRVREDGHTVWTVYAENEGHGFAKKDNRDYFTAVEVLFLKDQLGIE